MQEQSPNNNLECEDNYNTDIFYESQLVTYLKNQVMLVLEDESQDKNAEDYIVQTLINIVCKEEQSKFKAKISEMGLPVKLHAVANRYYKKVLDRCKEVVNKIKIKVINLSVNEWATSSTNFHLIMNLENNIKKLKNPHTNSLNDIYECSIICLNIMSEISIGNIKNEIIKFTLEGRNNFQKSENKIAVIEDIIEQINHIVRVFIKNKHEDDKYASPHQLINSYENMEKLLQYTTFSKEIITIVPSSSEFKEDYCLNNDLVDIESADNDKIKSTINKFDLVEIFLRLESFITERIDSIILSLFMSEHEVTKIKIPKEKITKKKYEYSFTVQDPVDDSYTILKFSKNDHAHLESIISKYEDVLCRQMRIAIATYIFTDNPVSFDLKIDNRIYQKEKEFNEDIKYFFNLIFGVLIALRREDLIQQKLNLKNNFLIENKNQKSNTRHTNQEQKKPEKTTRRKKKTRKKSKPNLNQNKRKKNNRKKNCKTVKSVPNNENSNEESEIQDIKHTSSDNNHNVTDTQPLSILSDNTTTSVEESGLKAKLKQISKKIVGFKKQDSEKNQTEVKLISNHNEPRESHNDSNQQITPYRENRSRSEKEVGDYDNIWGNIRKGKYQLGLQILRSLPFNNHNTPRWLMAKARCLQGIGDFFPALNIYKAMKNKNITTFLAMSDCYKKIGDYKESIYTLKQIQDWDQNIEALISIGYNYLMINELDNAFEYFSKALAIHPDNIQALIGLSRYYLETGQHYNAVTTLQSVPNYKQNKQVLLALYRCCNKIGNHHEGLRYLKLIPDDEKDNRIQITFGFCYLEMGRYNKSLKIFLVVLKHDDNNKDALNGIAKCHRKMGRFKSALKYNLKILEINDGDNEAITGIVLCYLDMKKPKDAIYFLNNLTNYEIKEKNLLLLSRCYKKVNNFQGAIHTLTSINNWMNNKLVSLNIAICYIKKGEDKNGLELLSSIITQFPSYGAAHYSYCRYLVDNEDEYALIAIKNALYQFPYNISLHLLMAKYYEGQGLGMERFNTLMEIKHQFPWYSDTYIDLLHYHLSDENEEEANKIINECFKRFSEHNILFRRIKNLQRMRPFMLSLCNTGNINSTEFIEIKLDANVDRIFSILKPICNECYLVGSTVWSLILSQNLNQIINEEKQESDFDFVGTCDESNGLFQNGFRQSNYIPFLYTAKIEDNRIDFFSLPTKKNLITKNYRKRDFTICALYCNPEGIVIDPTGIGLQDLMNKRLRMIGNPAIRLREDPVRLLRAIRYITAGFDPVKNLHDALLEWQPGEKLDTGHLYAVARKHMKTLDTYHYVGSLREYGLLEKIFNIPNSLNIQEAIIALEKLLWVNHADLFFVNNTQNFNSQLFKQVSRDVNFEYYANEEPENNFV